LLSGSAYAAISNASTVLASMSMSCFASGTRLLTASGFVPVERLAPGDLMVSPVDGGRAPARWVGHREVHCGAHPCPHEVWPMRVRRDAFGPEVPARDVLLSPDHAVFVDGVLIPVHVLADGISIVQERRDAITYWHVELDEHGILSAEGLPCESFLDTGQKDLFTEGSIFAAANADRARWGLDHGRRGAANATSWECLAFAPLVVAGPAPAAVRERIARRGTPPAGFSITGKFPV
jgi:hypothetical protein